jgi:hypothetical protein
MKHRRALNRNGDATRVNGAGRGITPPRPVPARFLSHRELVGVPAVLRWCWSRNFLWRRGR